MANSVPSTSKPVKPIKDPTVIWPLRSITYNLKLLTLFVLTTLVPNVKGLRCYTDPEATKSLSLECGFNTGCVKIYIDSDEYTMRLHREYGYPPAVGKLPELRPELQGDPVLFRGCFVLAVPDRCYNADDGKSYCWCSSRDLCNRGVPTKGSDVQSILVMIVLVLCVQKMFVSHF